MTRIEILGGVAIALAAIGGTACRGAGSEALPSGSRAGAAEAAPAATRLPQVAVAVPTEAALDASVEAPGSFIPFEEAGIAAEAGGPVTMVRIEEGARVSAEEVVVKLDEVKAELGVRQA